MRSIPTYQRTQSAKTLSTLPSPAKKDDTTDKKPDWMKRVQEQRRSKAAANYRASINKNCDLDLFSSLNEDLSSEITYLENEDDLAESYFPGARKLTRKSTGSLDKANLKSIRHTIEKHSQSSRTLSTYPSTAKKSATTEKKYNKPDWIKSDQELRKKNQEQRKKNVSYEKNHRSSIKNCDPTLFSSFTESTNIDITYLDNEDDLAESYFPGARKRSSVDGLSEAGIHTEGTLPRKSGYNFDELIEKEKD